VRVKMTYSSWHSNSVIRKEVGALDFVSKLLPGILLQIIFPYIQWNIFLHVFTTSKHVSIKGCGS
jgi:hypothetical protein